MRRMRAAPRTWLAGPADASEAARLLIEFRDWYGRSQPPDAAFHAGVERLIDERSAEYLLAASGDGAPRGVCQLRYRYGLWMAAEDCWLEDLYVSEDARGAGLGSALVAAAIERARKRGCGRIELDVSEHNPDAWRLYEGLGFSPAYKPPAPNVLMGLRLQG
jgi:GNAT superfamily N-acetyltransferase